MKIWTLSGFLGLPIDWDLFAWEHLYPVDWQQFSFTDLPSFAIAFNQWVQHKGEEENILMGYSLGGRLALHTLIDQPQLWKGAVIISAHPGLVDPNECQTRKEKDEKWANRFERENWEELMVSWNGQEVFSSSSFSFKRHEENHDRLKLAKALRGASLGVQKDLREQIATLPFPILWMTGALDHRFCQAAKTLRFHHPQSAWKSIPHAGHRVPWEQPQVFSEIVSSFLLNFE